MSASMSKPAWVPRGDRVIKRRCGLKVRAIDGEAVAYDPAHHAVGYLNPTALAVWSRLDGKTSAGRLAQQMALADDADLAAVHAYVEETLDALIEAGLVDEVLERGAP